MARWLIGCERSGKVRKALRDRGHLAWSCDLVPADDGSEFHIQDDVLLHLDCAPDGYPWDGAIFFPTCTYLCSSGLHWNKRQPEREAKTHDAMLFVLNLMGEGFVENKIPRIALENPIGRIGTAYRKADQIIQPWQFGHDASKATCLWLKGLPKLVPTKLVDPIYGCPRCRIRFPLALGKYGCPSCLGEYTAKPIWGNMTPSGQNKLGPSPTRAKERSETYQGIADAMADQWGNLC